jgi:hypothetical protein
MTGPATDAGHVEPAKPCEEVAKGGAAQLAGLRLLVEAGRDRGLRVAEAGKAAAPDVVWADAA